MIGTTLSHFKITAKLGEGGMGEVYRADDLKLGREVAIKVLPEAVAGDPERLARFEREAKVLAALNHPNIAAIYSLESVTGSPFPGRDQETSILSPDSAAAPPAHPLTFLVMELAAGENLKDRIARGPIPMEQALPIALQIAHALEAAHQEGIIHRDLKPANVVVDDEDNVKVLDFGLAKALDPTVGTSSTGGVPGSSASPVSLSPTLTAQMTGAGALLGTASYMSPEQARGKKVDKRADIFAFGVVLWEMLTGERLFAGETASDTLAAVLRADPDWEALGAGVPRPLHRVLRRCLEKNPAARLHDIADARLEIEEAIHPSETVEALGGEPQEAAAEKRGSVWMGLVVGLVVGALLASLGALWWGGDAAETRERAARVASVPPEEVVLRASDRPLLAISPNGQRLVMVGRREDDSGQLYQRQLSQYEWQPISGTKDALDPFFSPDGEWIAFFADDKLKKVPVAGGSPQVLCDASNPWGGSWGPDGTIVFYPSSSKGGLMRVSELGGTPEILTLLDSEAGEREHNWPQFLPDGRSVLFSIWKGTADRSQVGIVDLETRETRVLLDGSYGRVTPTGHLLFALADGVYVVPFDLDRRQVTGSPVPLPDPIYRFSDYWLPFLSVAENGTLAYLPGRSDIRRRLVTVGMDGTEEPLLEAQGAYMYPRISPDGSMLAVNIMEGGGGDIWLIDLETGARTRLTREGNNLYPLWTPDGRRIIYSSDRSGVFAIYWQPADGSGPEHELVVASPPISIGFPFDVSPDGKFLAFARWQEDEEGSVVEGGGVYLASLTEPHDQQPLLLNQTEGELYTGVTFSPDGERIAYVHNDPGQADQVFVQSFPELGARHQISTDQGLKVQWSPDGREIYYRASQQRFMAVSVATEPVFKAAPPRLLFKDSYDEGTYLPLPGYTVARDGSKLIMVKPDEELGRAAAIRIVFNWLDELETLVPGGAR